LNAESVARLPLKPESPARLPECEPAAWAVELLELKPAERPAEPPEWKPPEWPAEPPRANANSLVAVAHTIDSIAKLRINGFMSLLICRGTRTTGAA
jgi:hypothetical protein